MEKRDAGAGETVKREKGPGAAGLGGAAGAARVGSRAGVSGNPSPANRPTVTRDRVRVTGPARHPPTPRPAGPRPPAGSAPEGHTHYTAPPRRPRPQLTLSDRQAVGGAFGPSQPAGGAGGAGAARQERGGRLLGPWEGFPDLPGGALLEGQGST